MDKLPKKWQIKAKNEQEALIIAPYANEMSLIANYSKWNKQDALSYWLQMEDGEYYSGNSVESKVFTTITFQDFEKLVLNKNIENNYDIY